jgi:26S proteasome regulatory subunit N10
MRELGLKMKKNGVSIDIIDFGTENRGNTEILKELIDVVDSDSQPSRLITIESSGGVFLLDALKSKVPELFNRSSSGNGNEMMSGGDGFDFDPEMDPELAMALKLSMEEEVNRQKKTNGDGDEEMKSSNEEENNEQQDANEDEDDEEMMLARAIALSMEQSTNEKQ